MGSLRYFVKRLFQLIPLLFGVSLISFFLLRISPGDPARLLLGPRATDEQIASKRTELGLDENLVVQFIKFIGNLLTGDLGISIRSRQPVVAEIGDRLGVTECSEC